MKTLAVRISGLFSGLAGAQLAMDCLNIFLPDMTAGRGIIELAATLFGSGLTSMSAAASFMFGLFGAIGDRLQAFEVPDQFVLKLPYIAAIISNVGRACLTFAQRNPGHYIATFESGISINAKQLRHYLAHDIARVRGRISGTRRRTAQIGGFFHGHR